MERQYLQAQLRWQVMAADRKRLVRLQRDIKQAGSRHQPIGKSAQRLADLVDGSLARVESRRQSIPVLRYPEELPVVMQRQQLLDAIANNQVLIVAGATGSGKTTQLPKLCLELGYGTRGRIGHTQPRRIAARAVAARIASELDTRVGELVGYQVRFGDNCSDSTLIKLMTDGVLLAEIQHDRRLDQYDTLIIDEAHERSLNIDFILGYLKKLLPLRPDLKVIITSATIDVDSFSAYFDAAPVIDVSGRAWPVDLHYLQADPETESGLSEQVLVACEYIEDLERRGEGQQQGDILVFLPGERDIRDCALKLRRAALPHWDILPLYARLARAEQDRVFDLAKRRGRRVVLATNVAETSLTVPGIRYVIDTGLARISRYSHRSRVQRLPIEAISRASADQRSGRCGREAPGTCIRLYSEEDFNGRPEFTESEIHRTNLAAVVLQLTRLQFGDVESFPFIETPDPRLVRDGYRLLDELGAIDSAGKLTAIGDQLARIPADPRVGRMLLAGEQYGCLSELLVVAAAISIQDPRERPLDKQQAADQAHGRFRINSSDFMTLLKLWEYFEQCRQEIGRSQLRKLCRQEFLSVSRLFEWRDLHFQLARICRRLGLRLNHEPATQESVHRAVLTGLLSHVGKREEKRDYLGTRNRKFSLFPGSHLAKKPPAWIMATELVDTGKVYARINGAIEPEWVISAAGPLLKHSYQEPHFSRSQQAVMAKQKTSLYGLVLSESKLVSFGRIDPELARELYIRGALVEGNYRGKAGFWRHNQALLREVGELETRLRRHDLLVDDDDLYHFYDTRIPADIHNTPALEKWRKQVEKQSPRLLFLSRQQVLRLDPETDVQQQFPDSLQVADVELPLHYTFAPGGATDGVTAIVPLAALNRLPPARFDWLVPGLLREKCVELVKSLPRQWRKQLVPVPDTIDRVLPLLQAGDSPLVQCLSRAIQRQFGVTVPADAWSEVRLDPYYRMNFSVVDTGARVIASGRDLADLLARLRPQLRSEIVRAEPDLGSSVYRDWGFGELPPSRVLKHGTQSVLVYPAVVDHGEGVILEHCDRPEDANRKNRHGLARLYMLALAQQAKYLKKEFLRDNQARLQLGQLMPREQMLEDYLLAVFRNCFVDGQKPPRDEAQFAAVLAERQSSLLNLANDYHRLLMEIISLNHGIRIALGQLDENAWRYAIADMQQQLQALLGEHFLLRVNDRQIREYPRFLRALAYRIEKLNGHRQKDQRGTEAIAPHIERLQQLAGEFYENLDVASGPVEYRWMLEEYRVSLFAQAVGTRVPVSAKRLDRAWQQWQEQRVAVNAG